MPKHSCMKDRPMSMIKAKTPSGKKLKSPPAKKFKSPPAKKKKLSNTAVKHTPVHIPEGEASSALKKLVIQELIITGRVIVHKKGEINKKN